MARAKRTAKTAKTSARDAARSRARLLAAAAREFAARGFAGANVDRIARTARLNKAMIYYHFPSKAALYREIIRDMFDAIGRSVREVAASRLPPEEKVRGYIGAIAREGEARPHFPRMWLREITEGAEHVDRATLRYARDVLATLGRIIDEGCRADRFQPVDPVLIHIGIIAPLMVFNATPALRRKLARAGARGAATVSRDDVVAHIQRVTLAVLEGRIA
jgi:TetR/AcrR family transcriptional regulator